jgi:hypothetical protein
VDFILKIYESLSMMMILLKMVYGGGDLAKTAVGWRNIMQKREKIGGSEITWNGEF